MRLLVSVRSVDEALVVGRSGADFIDLKEPNHGALGGLPVATITAIVAALREQAITLPISATIGDHAPEQRNEILAQVDAVAACGVDYVKVGIERSAAAPALLDALRGAPHAIVPVFIADRGLEPAHVAQACALGFPALMIDTAAKRAGSLFDLLAIEAMRDFIDRAHAARALAGLAGALRLANLPALAALAPDYAGFRSAVCAGDRSGALDPARLGALIDAVRTRELAAGQ